MLKSPDAAVPVRNLWSLFKAQDFAWILFVGALMASTPERNYDATILLPLIGAFQIVEPRIRFFSSKHGQWLSLVLKLALTWLLVGYTHTFDSPYYSIFLIPIVSAATSYGFATVLLVTVIASLAYLSFLLPIYMPYVPPDSLYSILCLRVSFFAIIAFVVFDQARAKRQEMARTKEAADRLAESNKSLREAQASLRRSERLAALGQLTAGLAHELRNPLGTIKASAEMLNQKTLREAPQIATEMASYIESEVDRINGLITSFLNFARPLELHPVQADLNEVVGDVMKRQAALAAAKGVELKTEIEPEAAQFVFDPASLSIALGNLVQNAIQASKPGRWVKVRAHKVDGSIEIAVEDQGEGISPQNLENIFNPFFSTKADGVGLGLAIVSKIVDEHQGKIVPSSVLGEGTMFRITLPAAASA